MHKTLTGNSTPRIEGREKVTGRANYIDDISLPGMLYGATVRSSVARGVIRSISFEKDIDWDEFTIVTAKDIPGKNYIAHIMNDQPCLAETMVNHVQEPILLLAHRNRYLVEKARRSVKVDIEPLPAVLSIEDSLSKKDIVWGKDNIFKSCLINRGDVDRALKKAPRIVKKEYRTGTQEHLYLETNGVIASGSLDEGITLRGSMQCPYFVKHALCDLSGLPPEKVRVIQTETGGAFGGKEDYPSMIAAHAALLAFKSGHPVKLVYDRYEDMAATTRRHPGRSVYRTAVDKNGKLLVMDIEFVLDGGAYSTMSPVVLSRGTIHAAGPYYCPNIRIKGLAVATNFPPYGAFRGFGAPQAFFPLEKHMDDVANEIGLSPEKFRRINFIRTGEKTATSQIIRDPIDMNQLMDRALEMSDYHRKLTDFSAHNKRSTLKKGIGMSSFMHGAGFTGSGEKTLASTVAIEATPEGKIRVLASSVEMGQGKNTVFSQIAADALGIDIDLIDIPDPDTLEVPDSGPTVASRTTMVIGKLVERACRDLKSTLKKTRLLSEKYSSTGFSRAIISYVKRYGPLKIYSQYQQPPHIKWDEKAFRGDAYATFSWAVYIAEVSVDTTTFEVNVTDFVAVQEVGKVVNPVLAEGQIQGGVAQGIGWALYENVNYQEGRMQNCQMTNYIVPGPEDLPEIRTAFEEIPYEGGPTGAKGIGELPLNGTAPAIVNAIQNATGLHFNHLPVLPEDILKKMEGSDGS